MHYKTLTLTIKDGLARLKLNQPASGNPFNPLFCEEFNATVHELAASQALRCILLSAEGKLFSVGGDLATLSADLEALPATIRDLTSNMHMALQRLVRLDAPLVACVQGTAMGGAVSLIANCDLVYGARSARFGAAYSKLGFSCDAGASFGLASRMGVSRARRFLILSEMLDAVQAHNAGLVDFVVDDSFVFAEAEAAAIALGKGPTRAYGEIRRLCTRALGESFETQLENEAQGLAAVARSQDAKEGVGALKEKRTPNFHGH